MDELYLSYWVRGFTPHNMLRHFERILRKFPFSWLGPGIRLVRIYGIEYVEPPLFEQAFPEPPEIDAILELAKEFENADCAYHVEGAWDLWQFAGDWKLSPSPVTLVCHGPEFVNDIGDNLRLELGDDSLFLPQADDPASARIAQSNIRSVLQLAHDLDNSLAVEQRRLWTESGENFADRLRQEISR